MRIRRLAAALGLASLLVSGAAAAPGDDADKRFRDAFKPLKLPPAAKVEKEATPLLPGGIVTEAGPFDAVVRKLLEPFDAQLAARDAAAAEVGAAPESAAALVAAVTTLESENADLAGRVADVEASYAEVYAAVWSESGEKVHRARKLAAVLVPFYRTIAARNAAAAAKSSEALARSGDAQRATFLTVALGTNASPSVRAAAASALGQVGGDAPREALRKACASDAVPAVRVAALVALQRWKIAEVKDAAVAALGDAAWEVRALAAVVCARSKLVEAVPALVAALEKEDGRLRQDLDDALHALVGVRMYGDAALWRKWLDENRAKVDEQAKAAAASGEHDRALGPLESWETAADAAPAEKRKDATSAFYGIETPSKRVLFVADISKSMEEAAGAMPAATTGAAKDPYPAPEGKSKLDVAKWQLHRAVHALPKDAAFDIVVYSESYKAWMPQMTEATPAAKKQAHAFIDGLRPNGTTNICDALDEAFEIAGAAPLAAPAKGARPGLAADTVYLMSDGVPNRGRLSDPNAMVESFVARTRAARIVVHGIGIGEAAGNSLLETLAKRTGGQYVAFR